MHFRKLGNHLFPDADLGNGTNDQASSHSDQSDVEQASDTSDDLSLEQPSNTFHGNDDPSSKNRNDLLTGISSSNLIVNQLSVRESEVCDTGEGTNTEEATRSLTGDLRQGIIIIKIKTKESACNMIIYIQYYIYL